MPVIAPISEPVVWYSPGMLRTSPSLIFSISSAVSGFGPITSFDSRRSSAADSAVLSVCTGA